MAGGGGGGGNGDENQRWEEEAEGWEIMREARRGDGARRCENTWKNEKEMAKRRRRCKVKRRR